MITVDERDITKVIAEVEATSWRLRKTIRVRELAVTHRLEHMRRLLMLEEQKAWKREAGFVYTETAAETDARRSRSNVVSGTLFYRNMFNLSRPYILDEFTLEMRVDVECLRMEVTLTQPAPQPRYDPTPRRLRAADTGSEEPGTLRRSLAIGTGSEGPGVSRAQTSTDTEEMFPLESSTYVFFAFKLHKPRAGVYFASARRRGRR